MYSCNCKLLNIQNYVLEGGMFQYLFNFYKNAFS